MQDDEFLSSRWKKNKQSLSSVYAFGFVWKEDSAKLHWECGKSKSGSSGVSKKMVFQATDK